jgi:endoglucanase
MPARSKTPASPETPAKPSRSRLVSLAALALGAAMPVASASAARARIADAIGSAFGAGHDDAHRLVRELGRGINIGNALEAPHEGQWGVRLSARLFDRIAQAGFRTVRLPVRWSNHAKPEPPFTIDTVFFSRVDAAIEEATRRGMRVVVNMHHHRQLDGDPLDDGEFGIPDAVLHDRFVRIWEQVATRYRDIGADRLLFEPYNEPHNALNAPNWNRLLARTIPAIRRIDARRVLVVGPVDYNDARRLPHLELPSDDQRIIATIHSYEPREFTHQGAAWMPGADEWLGTRCCTDEQLRQATGPLDMARDWSRETGRPIWVGEFGAIGRADHASRLHYTRALRQAIEERGFTWAYWEIASHFGLYDPVRDRWDEALKQALLG